MQLIEEILDRVVMRLIEQYSRNNTNIWKCNKKYEFFQKVIKICYTFFREAIERRRALKLQYDFLQVVRRLINVRLAEITELDCAADRRFREILNLI